MKSTTAYLDKIQRLGKALERADAVVIGAGAGLSAAAGLTYSGERFERYFADFIEKYGIKDMYSGGFYPFPDRETFWGWWSRHIWVNRYMDAPAPVYNELLVLVRDKDYFVLTTNVDHCFQKAGFDKKRLFYTQGDYGLWQCSSPCHQKTYDNMETVRKMLVSQGFETGPDGELSAVEKTAVRMSVPAELVPLCPVCGEPMSMNLRADGTFVQDEGWHEAAGRYMNFIRTRENQAVLYLELGVGYNTPGIIKYPFWKMTRKNPDAVYACINFGDAVGPDEIEKQSVCIDGDIADVLHDLAALEQDGRAAHGADAEEGKK